MNDKIYVGILIVMAIVVLFADIKLVKSMGKGKDKPTSDMK